MALQTFLKSVTLTKYSAHWILPLASIKGVEVAIDSAVAISRVFYYKTRGSGPVLRPDIQGLSFV